MRLHFLQCDRWCRLCTGRWSVCESRVTFCAGFAGEHAGRSGGSLGGARGCCLLRQLAGRLAGRHAARAPPPGLVRHDHAGVHAPSKPCSQCLLGPRAPAEEVLHGIVRQAREEPPEPCSSLPAYTASHRLIGPGAAGGRGHGAGEGGCCALPRLGP